MDQLFINEQGTDIRVSILEYIDRERVRVRAIVGWPFGCDSSTPGKAVRRCTKNEKVVNRDEIKVISSG